MTYEQTREHFLLAWNSNAYLNMCESDDMHNAIVALEKQIPKKLKGDGWLYCPICGRDVLMDRFNYCPDCGQALDWSDNDA